MIFKEKPDIEFGFRETTVQLKIDTNGVREFCEIFDKMKVGVDYKLTLKKSGRRSLNANSYHWLLCGKIADACGVSKHEIHNALLSDYGVDWLDSNGELQMVALPDSTPYRKNETLHLRATSESFERNGVLYRWFVLLLPSHLMDSTQMARLISGTVQEAQQIGILTETDARISEMTQRWEPKYE